MCEFNFLIKRTLLVDIAASERKLCAEAPNCQARNADKLRPKDLLPPAVRHGTPN
jgi:hypothetical protein